MLKTKEDRVLLGLAVVLCLVLALTGCASTGDRITPTEAVTARQDCENAKVTRIEEDLPELPPPAPLVDLPPTGNPVVDAGVAIGMAIAERYMAWQAARSANIYLSLNNQECDLTITQE